VGPIKPKNNIFINKKTNRMKKVILALALVVTLAFVSCKNDAEATTTTTDSTAVAVDSVAVDTAAVATDSVQ
jgi:hypothetical protein